MIKNIKTEITKMAITRRRSFVVKPIVTERIPTRSISSLNLGNLQSELDNLSFKSDESSQSTKSFRKLSEKFAKFSQKLKSLKKFQKKALKLGSIEEPAAKKARVNWVAPKEKFHRKKNLTKQMSKPILRRKESLIEMNRGSIIVVWEEDLN